MNSRLAAMAILVVGLGSLPPIRADDAPGAPTIAVPDSTPYLDAAGAAVVGVSRDGSKVFFTRRVAGIVQLFVIDGFEQLPRQLTERSQSLSFAIPSPDGTRVILGYDHDGDENNRLFVIESTTATPTLREVGIVGAGIQRGSVVWTPEGDRIYYRANDVDRASFRIHSHGFGEIGHDVDFHPSGTWRIEDASRGGDRLLLVRERSSRESSLFLFHVGTRSLSEIHANAERVNGVVGEARFVGDGSKIVFVQEYLHSNLADTYAEAWLYDVASGSTVPTPRQGLGSKHGCMVYDGDIEGIAASMDGTRVILRKGAPGAPDQLAVVDVATNEELMTPACPPGELAGLFVDSYGRLFSTRRAPSDPGSILRWDPNGSTRTTIVSADLGGLDPTSMPADPVLITYASGDMPAIPAWLWLPRGRAPKNLPFIVSIHGGPEGEDRPGWHGDRAYLLSIGFGVLAPNIRGSTGHGRRYRGADDGAKRMDAVRDAKAAADWLVEEGYADPKRLGVMGGSYGGFMVMALLTEFPDRFVAGAEAVGIVNFETFLEKTSSYRRALREAEYGSLSDRELLRSISPIHKLDRITAALLVAHGENDPRVPVGEARQIESELKRLGRPVETLIFPDEGHGWRKPANRKKHLETLARFFLKHLAPR